jgi:hypothetical protein
MCKHIISPLWGQNADTTAGRFRRFDVFPAISYSPETKLTLGVIGYAYFDWWGGDVATPLSFWSFWRCTPRPAKSCLKTGASSFRPTGVLLDMESLFNYRDIPDFTCIWERHFEWCAYPAAKNVEPCLTLSKNQA